MFRHDYVHYLCRTTDRLDDTRIIGTDRSSHHARLIGKYDSAYRCRLHWTGGETRPPDSLDHVDLGKPVGIVS